MSCSYPYQQRGSSVCVVLCGLSCSTLSIRLEGNMIFEAKFPVETPAETPHRVANDDRLGTGRSRLGVFLEIAASCRLGIGYCPYLSDIVLIDLGYLYDHSQRNDRVGSSLKLGVGGVRPNEGYEHP